MNTEHICKTHNLKKLLFNFSSFSREKTNRKLHKKRNTHPLKKTPNQTNHKKTQTKSEKTTSSDILGPNCKWYVHPNYYSSLSKLLEKSSTLQITL